MSTPAFPTPGSAEHERLWDHMRLEWTLAKIAVKAEKAAENPHNWSFQDVCDTRMATHLEAFKDKWNADATFDNNRIDWIKRVLTDELTDEERRERGQSHAGAVQVLAGLVYAGGNGQPMNSSWEQTSAAHFAKWGKRILPSHPEVVNMAGTMADLAGHNPEE